MDQAAPNVQVNGWLSGAHADRCDNQAVGCPQLLVSGSSSPQRNSSQQCTALRQGMSYDRRSAVVGACGGVK